MDTIIILFFLWNMLVFIYKHLLFFYKFQNEGLLSSQLNLDDFLYLKIFTKSVGS